MTITGLEGPFLYKHLSLNGNNELWKPPCNYDVDNSNHENEKWKMMLQRMTMTMAMMMTMTGFESPLLCKHLSLNGNHHW